MAEFLKHFDVANAQLTTGRRHQTVVPQQSLFRMNSLLVIEQARNIVERPEFQQASGDAEKVKALYEIIFQRWPKVEETNAALAFIQGKEADGDVQKAEANKYAEAEKHLQTLRDHPLVKADPTTLKQDQRQKRKELLERIKQRENQLKEKEKSLNKRGEGLRNLVTDPDAEMVDRTPLSSWEKYTHALLLTNEVLYVN
jgi:flagellar motility protein MotE (MotC chaperone)